MRRLRLAGSSRGLMPACVQTLLQTGTNPRNLVQIDICAMSL
jgi:hypothetical protein